MPLVKAWEKFVFFSMEARGCFTLHRRAGEKDIWSTRTFSKRQMSADNCIDALFERAVAFIAHMTVPQILPFVSTFVQQSNEQQAKKL